MKEAPNLAATLAGLCRPRSFTAFLLDISRRRLSPRARERAVICADGDRVHSIAAVRPRSGVKSWEVSHLYANSVSDDALGGLLEMAAASAASEGGERLFLRIAADSDIEPIARRAGFSPCFKETLYKRAPGVAGRGSASFGPESRLTERGQEHDYPLFRLYNAVTPVKARQLMGMTFEQWQASDERVPRRLDDMALEIEGATVGRFGIASGADGVRLLTLALHPDHAALTADMVDAGIRKSGGDAAIMALAADYAPTLGICLETRGFRAEAEFSVLARPTAQAAKRSSSVRSPLAAAE